MSRGYPQSAVIVRTEVAVYRHDAHCTTCSDHMNTDPLIFTDRVTVEGYEHRCPHCNTYVLLPHAYPKMEMV